MITSGFHRVCRPLHAHDHHVGDIHAGEHAAASSVSTPKGVLPLMRQPTPDTGGPAEELMRDVLDLERDDDGMSSDGASTDDTGIFDVDIDGANEDEDGELRAAQRKVKQLEIQLESYRMQLEKYRHFYKHKERILESL